MTPLSVTPDIDRWPWNDLPDNVARGTLERIGLLRNGTNEGRASVGMVMRLEDGTPVIVQTTWRLLRNAVRALDAGPVGSEEADN